MRPPQSWSKARLTLVLAAATVAAWVLAYPERVHEAAVLWGAFVPADVTLDLGIARAPVWLTPLTATLLHADFLHLLLNLVVLLLCGRAVENLLGPASLATLYLVGAYVSAAAHYFIHPLELVPAMGASGAVSAVLGAYALLFGRNKVKTANARLGLWLNTAWLIAAWVGLNLLVGLTVGSFDGGIAVAAHIGGFLSGVALAYPLLLLRYRNA